MIMFIINIYITVFCLTQIYENYNIILDNSS